MPTTETFTGYTLIDITKTGDICTDTRYRNQQRNWEVISQVIGLRANIEVLAAPAILEVNLSSLDFGKAYSGTHYVWRFVFTALGENAFFNGVSRTGILDSDFENVPVTTGLAETVKLTVPVFNTDNLYCNIYFKINT